MNIKEAKEYIKDTVSAYLKKDEFGDYRIPLEKQRPVFLTGAPGIGKTAIMGQIANELNIALVSYSMTHHTRQSALGLPFITKKVYDGEEVSVSEYTMSEIIASVYDTMNESGVKEGILFLDEINCVSETLYPSMLQFLQYKVFGKHRVPEGWVIVTAGNPPEYNRAVREFDVVTLDRLKVINAEADYPAWKAYASQIRIHGAVAGFLESDRDSFYKVETTAYGKTYVTARGWEDLSDMIKMYEEDGKTVNDSLFTQYITNEKIAKDFSAYYDLYNKYKKQYDVDAVFSGSMSEGAVSAASSARADERLALTGMLADRVKNMAGAVRFSQFVITSIRPVIAKLTGEDANDAAGVIDSAIMSEKDALRKRQRAGTLTDAEKKRKKSIIKTYTYVKDSILGGKNLREVFNEKVAGLNEDVSKLQKGLDNLFEGMEKMFGANSNEMLYLLTELTVNEDTAGFLSDFGSESYERYSFVLKVGDRTKDLKKEISEISGLL